ncbi:hypothetical protein STEG23_023706 [Scotinomys teguina]
MIDSLVVFSGKSDIWSKLEEGEGEWMGQGVEMLSGDQAPPMESRQRTAPSQTDSLLKLEKINTPAEPGRMRKVLLGMQPVPAGVVLSLSGSTAAPSVLDCFPFGGIIIIIIIIITTTIIIVIIITIIIIFLFFF